jgi:hypothetical protein
MAIHFESPIQREFEANNPALILPDRLVAVRSMLASLERSSCDGC